MKLLGFKARALNGHLDFDLVAFNPTVTFLTGINGSGKTSLIRAVMALLTPDIDWLMNNQYESISLDILHDSATHTISARRKGDNVRLSYVAAGSDISYVITPTQYRRMSRERFRYDHDDEGELIQVTETVSLIPDGETVFQRIQQLPTPIFLGLDRTTLASGSQQGRRRNARRPQARRPHITIRSFLDDSVAEAESLAEEARRAAELKRTRRADALREDLLLAFFQNSPKATQTGELPKSGDIRRLEKTRRSLKTAFSFLGIPDQRLEASIDPFFSELISAATELQGVKINELTNNSPYLSKIIAWFANAPKLATIRDVEVLVNRFNEEERSLFSDVNRYLDVINSFFQDSGKRVSYNKDGSLSVKLPSGVDGDVYYLSSGERQLFVLITALMFNDVDSQAEILIIDEPELSLHIKWQEAFVDSLMIANPDAQLILATHSPSIILDKDKFCVGLA